MDCSFIPRSSESNVIPKITEGSVLDNCGKCWEVRNLLESILG